MSALRSCSAACLVAAWFAYGLIARCAMGSLDLSLLAWRNRTIKCCGNTWLGENLADYWLESLPTLFLCDDVAILLHRALPTA